MWAFLAFLALPIVEIALFIQVGGLIGLWPTLLLVILAAAAGTALIRAQGLRALPRLRERIAAGEDPSGPMADGALILVAALLLVIPGFFTDALGLVLLVPAARAALIRRAAASLRLRSVVLARGPAPRRRPGGETIEGEFEVLDDLPPAQRGASGWTRPLS